MRKHAFIYITVLALLLSLLPLSALAYTEGEGYTGRSFTRDNPWLPPADYTESATYDAPAVYGVPKYLTDAAAVSAALGDAMAARAASVTVYYRTDHHLSDEELDELFYGAFAETGAETRGDYLRLSWQRYRINVDCQISDAGYDHTLTYYVTYETTAEQEAELDAALTEVMTGFGFTEDSTDYYKVRTIYHYICTNVTYDYETLYDDDYRLKYTAYAALLHKTAVCEGYAELFYRMAIRAGLQPRIITGRSFGGNHAWNIVRLDSLYYNLDTTWDAGSEVYEYFLKGSTDFPNHSRESQFEQSSFHSLYPTAKTAYVFTCDTHEPAVLPAVPANCQTEGLTQGAVCRICGVILTQQTVVPLQPHSFADGVCTVCGQPDAPITYTYAPDTATLTVSGAGPIPSYGTDDAPWADCRGDIRTLIIESGITAIGSDCFRDCTALETLHLPATVTVVGTNAFSGCTALTEISFDGTAEQLGSVSIGDGNDSLLAPIYRFTAFPCTHVTAVLPPVAPDCTTEGLTLGTQCGFCGEILSAPAAVPPLGHTYDRGLCIRCGEADPYGENPFLDVNDADYFRTPVLWAVSRGITSGTAKYLFSPYAPCTRGQAMTFLWRAAGSPAPTTQECPFSDIAPTDYYYSAVLWAVEHGITGGIGGGRFGPEQTCTRGQIVTFLHRSAAPAHEPMINPFADVSPFDYYYEPVLWAARKGITGGTGPNTFSPDAPCTRGQIVTFLYQAYR